MKLYFLFVGPQRTGTTWLYDHLKRHPDLCFPKGVKETMFFDRNLEKGLSWYNWHFSECKSKQKVGEIAPTYFDSSGVPSQIKKHFPQCKIVISLRNPVQRAQSLYQHHYQKGRVKGTFTEAIEKMPRILTSGYYKDHISQWLKYFEEDQILVLWLEEIKNNPEGVINKLCSFLDIRKGPLLDRISNDKVNTAFQPRITWFARLSSEIVTWLHSHRFHFVVNMAKKVGLKKMFLKPASNKPVLTIEEKHFLNKEFSSHIEYVKENFGEISPR